MQQHLAMMTAYNAWANGRLYGAAAELSEEEFGRDVGAFFRSLKGTLNHVLVADRIWMRRFTGEGEHPAALNAILHEALPELRSAREAEDGRISGWVAGLSEQHLADRFTYVTVTDSRTVTQRLAPALAHFFNHQTHHRGQAHTILSVLGKQPPPLDLIYFLRTINGREFA